MVTRRSLPVTSRGAAITRDKSLVLAQSPGVFPESEDRGGFSMSRLTGLEVGTGSGSVCRHGMDRGGSRPCVLALKV